MTGKLLIHTTLKDAIAEPLTIGSAVVDDGDFLGFECVDRVLGHRFALLEVVGDNAVGNLEALLRQFRAGRDNTGDVSTVGLPPRGRRSARSPLS